MCIYTGFFKKRVSYSTHLSACNFLQLIVTLLLIQIVQSFTTDDPTTLEKITDIQQVLEIDNSIGHPLMKLRKLNSTPSNCSRAEENLDRCSAKLIAFGYNGLAYPNSMDELDSFYCSELKSSADCIGNVTFCFRPFERQIINWILSSSRKMNHKRCKNEPEKMKFLRLTNSCLMPMKIVMDKCMKDYIASLDVISQQTEVVGFISENDIQIQLSCCANRRFKSCIMESAKHQCKSRDGLKKLKRTNSVSSLRIAQKFVQKTKVDMMEDLKKTLDGMALTGPEIFCSGVDENFCQTNFEGRYTSRVQRHKSIVPAMLKIYSNK